jgi:hypothetical protein
MENLHKSGVEIIGKLESNVSKMEQKLTEKVDFFIIFVLLALPWLVLNLRNRGARYSQTLAAFAGTGALFTLAFLPVAIQAAGLPPPDLDLPPTRQQLTIGWITLGLVGWKLAINGNIWRNALDWPRSGGLLLAVGVFLFEIGVMRAVFVSAAG